MLVSINIVAYNEEENIEKSLSSAFNQSYKPIEVFLIDNASRDRTVEKAKEIYKKSDKSVPFSIIENAGNFGFGGGHNVGFKKSTGDFVLCLNADCELDKDYVQCLLEVFEKDKSISAAQGKLANPRTGGLDTTGLLIFKNRRVINRGQGEEDKGQYEKPEEIWGVDGAAPIYRRAALEDTKIPIQNNRGRVSVESDLTPVESDSTPADYEYFDEDFFAYKEDVDLSWRMRLLGWKMYYEPRALAYHDRSAGEGTSKKFLEIARARRGINDFAKYHSFANQRLMQIKNETPLLFLKHAPLILAKEVVSWPYVLIFERYGIKSAAKFFRFFLQTLRKRKFVMAKKRIKDKEMEEWFL